MDKAQALHNFWSGFGLSAYNEYTVPDNPNFPYITYSCTIDSLGNPVMNYGSLWYYSTSWAGIIQKTKQIELALTNLKPIKIDGGYMWLYKGTPFAQRMSDPNSSEVRRMYINIVAEFITAE